ncbi:MAG: hypothetical protein ACO1QB_03045 [Verrucomicrobiales bacterium]
MSAALCQIEESLLDVQQQKSAKTFIRVGVKVQPTWCPHCQSLIYSKRQKFCGVCEQALPEKLLFNNSQSRNVKSLLEEERQKHRAWLRKASERSWPLN